ncbi:complex I NDUFA9 subunit family protein [Modicisalibacter tunisiensis]|uniref:complex I NDUFA9 subunit family protein n=1 Tax=Modicisalibacter tunisiensis TaxID=390637 RepID=UPI001CCA95F2|nr:complex I NDUFA9 subunit family protein [Modicisalibacter tunisiensis]MBZ9538839.1 complex I NDUFA9 subunit family protein [Modicisalibacter tunisiensis]
MTTQRVTVFGGTGFLGRRLVERLARAGCAVIVAARHDGEIAVPDASGTIVFRRTDVRDADDVAAALDGADAAVNAVSLYVERHGLSFEAIHVDAAARIARQAAEAGLRLVHVSGIGVDTRSDSAYVRARAAGENAVRQTHPDAVVVRPSVLFGPDDAFSSSLRMLARLPVVPLFGRGETRLQPVHVDDVAEAMARILERGITGATFELGGSGVHRYRDLVRAALDAAGRHPPRVPVPFALWRALSALLAVLPSPPLTRDQVILLETDNIVGEQAQTFAALGIEPRDLLRFLTQGR